jgi:hypothetical protein
MTASLLRREGRQVVTTSRDPRSGDAVRFALEDPSTWDGLPGAGACVWLFPAEPFPLVRDFARMILPRFSSLVVIGTTSSYLPEGTGSPVDERTPLNSRSERVRGEILLREEGAVVLRSAGIYGPAVFPRPARNPLDWLRRGLIRDGEKILNLIHVGDLAQAIASALRSSVFGEDFIVADGHPRPWKEIAAWGNARGFLPGIALPDLGGGGGKRLVTDKLRKMLAPAFAHGDLWRELDRLEGGG